MKTFCLLIFLFIVRLGFTQNWDLFPEFQKSYYSQDGIIEGFDFVVVDTIENYGLSQIFKFDPWGFYEIQDECVEAIEQAIENNEIYCEDDSVNRFPFIDSIIVRNDTSFIYSGAISYDLFFLTNSVIGDEWNILPPEYEEIVLRCTSIEEEEIFGIVDSVKTFTFFDPGIGTIDSKSIILSKNYGFTKFIDFNFMANYTGGGAGSEFMLEGFTIDEMRRGFYLRDYEDYFGYNIGDILLWKRHYSNPVPFYFLDYYEYYRDSIVEKFVYEDSIVFGFDRIKKDSSGVISILSDQKITYHRSGFDPLVLSHDGFISIASNQFAGLGDLDIWCNGDFDILFGDDTTITRTFHAGVNSLNFLPECSVWFIFDLGYLLKMQTGLGVIFTNYSSNEMSVTWELIGYNIGGEIFGETDINNVSITNFRITEINIHPNPSDEFIQIDLAGYADYSIHDLNGQIVKNGIFLHSTISIQDLSSGIYFLELRTETEILRGKFIKSNG